jgi:hypothetical protein
MADSMGTAVVGVMIQSSAQTEERQDRQNDHDKSDQIDNSVHGNLLH